MTNDNLLFMILIAFVSILLLLIHTLKQSGKLKFMEFMMHHHNVVLKELIDKSELKEEKNNATDKNA